MPGERSGNQRRALPGVILRYVAGFAAGWLALNLGFFQLETRGREADPAGTLLQKMRHFAEHRDEYDVVFVGDSRTYCAMHPDLLDPVLETRSINLARWAHWFPTQYPQFEELLPLVGEETVVVWSIGHQNFRGSGERLHTAYPIGLGRVPFYLELGFRADDLVDNLLFHNPTTTLVGWLPQLRTSTDARLERELWRGSAAAATPPTDLAALLDRVERQAATARWELRRDEGRTTSLAVQKTNGAYERIEIDHRYFRDKQRETVAETAEEPLTGPFEPDPRYWRLFLALLDLFQEHDVRLVVNELEEAPHVYRSASEHDRVRQFMRERVAPEVRRRGFVYLRADFDRLTDADYFDYNHLNSRGIRTYTALFAEAWRGDERL